MTDDQPATSIGTGAADYGRNYYTHAHFGSGDDYGWDFPHWRTFFTMVAERIVGLTEPQTALDVGCATGMLVQALRYRGVDAKGFDFSEFAVNSAHQDVRDHLWVGSATDPIEGRYDLISCIEVLEHMAPTDAQKALDSICAATDKVLFSSCPTEFEEPTHINSHPTSQWAAWFAERGFYRNTGADATFLAGWAVVFERADLSRRSIVERYEQLVAPLQQEVADKRRALLEAHRQQASGPASSMVDSDKEFLARHADLTARDHVIGLEASLSAAEAKLRDVRSRNRQLRDKLEAVEAQASAGLARKVVRRLRRGLTR